ncbi:MAG: glycosyltransferase family 2 protein [Acidimicrobiales bacterium]
MTAIATGFSPGEMPPAWANHPSVSSVGLLSVVIPFCNEKAVVGPLVTRLRPVLDGLIRDGHAASYELVCVDDGSTDGTVRELEGAGAGWPELCLLVLRRNVGQQIAITAGLEAASGDWAVTLDADLQDPPELLPDMLRAAARHGVDVVYACHGDRPGDGRLARTLAAGYYRVVGRLAGVPLQPHVGDYRLMSRRVLDALAALPERHRVHRLLLPWLGFSSVTLSHRREPRAAGATHYSTWRLLNITIDSIVGFTTAPLRIATLLGVATGLVSLALTVVSVIAKVAGASIPGWASLAVAVTFLGGVQLICTGVLGEYVGRTFAEVQRRPLYDVATARQPGRERGEEPGRFQLRPAEPGPDGA